MSIRKLVIVLDDDPGMLRGLERLLKISGFDAELFSSVEDFQRHAALNEAMCLVLDVNLNGESGIDLQRGLKSSGISLPVIFITANDSDAVRQAATDVGCIAYLAKPFPAKSLIDAVVRAS